MTDIVISKRRIARELQIFAACILAAFALNAVSILWFKTEWRELITTLHITLILAAIFFAFIALLRGLVLCAKRLYRRKAE
jgi:hypothetical protein